MEGSIRKLIYGCIACFICLSSLVSCKPKAVLLSQTTKVNKSITSDKIIENHYSNKKEFSTLYIKSNARYDDGKQSQNVTAEIKIKKDEIILISIRFLGITMAKALITPNEVKYYEKIGGKYFEGNYSILSNWLGTDLDFQKIQNMLIGQALDNLKSKKYTTTLEDNLYKLENDTQGNTKRAYYFESDKFLIKKEEITQIDKQRTVKISYPNYIEYKEMLLPTGLQVDAFQSNGNTNINIDYNTATFNEQLSFPYSVPDGYERIFIK